jgi:hypothetical protein
MIGGGVAVLPVCETVYYRTDKRQASCGEKWWRAPDWLVTGRTANDDWLAAWFLGSSPNASSMLFCSGSGSDLLTLSII